MKTRRFPLTNLTLHGAQNGVAGPAVLFLHGVTRTWEDFGAFIPSLPATWNIAAVDLRGHGQSSRAAAYRVVDYAADIDELIERHLPDQSVTIYGHSLGSLIAMAVAARQPSRVRALVLEDPPLDLLGERIQQSIYFDMFVGYQELVRSQLPVTEMLPRLANLLVNVPGLPPGQKRKVPLGTIRDPASLRYLTDCLAQLDPQVLAPLVSGEWTQGLELAEIIEAVRCPVLALQGTPELGGMCTDADAADLAQKLPQAKVVKFPEAGHLVHLMATDAAVEATVEFLKGLTT